MERTPAARARSIPLRFGTNTGYCVEGRRTISAITAAASLNCGIARGLTNEVASTTGKPASASIWIKRIFCSVVIRAFSFCKPSRGPTSTTRTDFGRWEVIAFMTRHLDTDNVRTAARHVHLFLDERFHHRGRATTTDLAAPLLLLTRPYAQREFW